MKKSLILLLFVGLALGGFWLWKRQAEKPDGVTVSMKPPKARAPAVGE